jgi:dienelactone hydrolase
MNENFKRGEDMKMTTQIFIIFAFIACSHTKKIETQKQAYTPVVNFSEDKKNFEGKIQFPKDFKEPLPLIVIVHEWWGKTENMNEKSAMLNNEGYATLAVDLYGEGKTVETPTEAQAMAMPFYQNPNLGIERLKKFIELAKVDPHINPSKIFVIGYCFGGTQALNLARSGMEIKGVVAFHAGLTSSMQATTIKTSILALNGLADSMVPKKDRLAFEKEMKSLNANFQMINYKGAKHAFTNQKATEIGKKYNLPVAYNKKADEESWKELLKFLKK